MPLENVFGLIGSLLLLVAPGRDQFLRLRAAYLEWRRLKVSETEHYWRLVFLEMDNRRNSWNVWDSLTMASGAILLAMSYLGS